MARGLVAMTTVAIAEQADVADLTFLQWRLLVVVGEPAEPPRLSALATLIGTSRPSATRLVQRLRARGLVTTRRDARDGRGVRVELTPTGATVRAQIFERRRELIRAALGDRRMTGRTAAELADLADLMRR